MRFFSAFLFFYLIKFSSLGQVALVNPEVRSNAVLAQFNNSSGSGFYIQDSGNVYFATARHVILNPKTNLPYEDSLSLISYREDVENDPKIVLKLSINSAIASKNLIFDQANDILIIRIAKLLKIDSLDNKAIIYFPFCLKKSPSSRINGWPTSDILKFDNIEAGRDIYIIGYPKSLGLLGRFDLDRPLYRKGIIAGKDKNFHRIIGDASVYFGNSGGMVLELYYNKRGQPDLQLIGLVSEYIPYNDVLVDLQGNTRSIDNKNSGYSVIVPADEILEMTSAFN